jgi:acyl-protein synthetase LuxE
LKSPAQDLLETPPYSLGQPQKDAVLTRALGALTQHHYRSCDIYRDIVDRVFGGPAGPAATGRLEDVPFLPVSLFKTHELKSVADSEIIKVLTSSGTGGQSVSRVYLDAETARIQSAVLVKVVQHFLGKDRLPMVILDHEGVVRDRKSHSARGAGILGMAQFGRRPFYALREDMSLDDRGLLDYLAAARGGRILLFGFTYMVWSSFVQVLEERGLKLDLTDAVLVHTGGWKKLQDLAVSPRDFRDRLRALTGIRSVINFYGMAEQVGGVYFENDLHYLHAPIYSDVIIRDPVTLATVPDGEVGLIQVLSSLPVSYPGHSILTEDLGVIRGCDAPDLAMKGRYFEMLGRVPESELRGCSDTFQPMRTVAP